MRDIAAVPAATQKPGRGWLEELAHDADMLGRGTKQVGVVRATRIDRRAGEDEFVRLDGQEGAGVGEGAREGAGALLPPAAPAAPTGDGL